MIGRGFTSSYAEPGIGTLLRDLADESRLLVRQEVELAKAEMVEKSAVLGRSAAYLAIGGLVAYTGVLAIVAAASIGLAILLARGMSPNIAWWLGPLIVGVVVAVIGSVLVQKALNTFKRESLAPQKTIRSLQENKQWLQDRMTSETPVA